MAQLSDILLHAELSEVTQWSVGEWACPEVSGWLYSHDHHHGAQLGFLIGMSTHGLSSIVASG